MIFDDELAAEETAVRIKKLRRELGLSDYCEFRFSKCSKKIKCKFLETIKDAQFRVRAIVMEKSKIYSLLLRESNESFYSYAIKMVLQHNGGTIKNAKLRLDGHGGRKFKKSFNAYLRQQLNSGNKEDEKIIKKLQFVDSKNNVLIQLADMVAGSLRRSYDLGKTDRLEYIDIIRHRYEDIWEFR